MCNSLPNSRRCSTGFSLIEVMVTVAIMAFGLIGLAGLITKGLGLNTQTYHRSIASQQAYDMADRIRANGAQFKANAYDSITYTANQNCTFGGNIAAYDACYWNQQNETLMPMGRGTVTRSGPNEFIISVTWDSNKDGEVNSSDSVFALRARGDL